MIAKRVRKGGRGGDHAQMQKKQSKKRIKNKVKRKEVVTLRSAQTATLLGKMMEAFITAPGQPGV